MTQNRAWRGAALAFLVTLGAGAAFINVVEQRRAEARKSSAIQIGAARGRLLESRLNAALSRAEALALLVRQDQPGAPLDSFVAELRRSSGSMKSASPWIRRWRGSRPWSAQADRCSNLRIEKPGFGIAAQPVRS